MRVNMYIQYFKMSKLKKKHFGGSIVVYIRYIYIFVQIQMHIHTYTYVCNVNIYWDLFMLALDVLNYSKIAAKI